MFPRRVIVMPIQLVLACVAVQTIVIGLLVADQRRSKKRKQVIKSHSFDRLLADFSKNLATGNPDQLDEIIEGGLQRLLRIIGGGRVCWYEKRENSTSLERVYSVHRADFPASPQSIQIEDIPYIARKLTNNELVAIRDPRDLPPEAARDRQFLQDGAVRGLVLIASDCDTPQKGILGIAYVPGDFRWSNDLLSHLTVMNNLIATTIERKLAYERLHESEKRFRCLFRNAPIGIALEDLDGRLLFVNPALCSMLGYNEEELRGMRCEEFSDPAFAKEEERLFQKLRSSELPRYRLEKQFIRRDQSRVWGRLDVTLLRDGTGGTPYVIGMMEDITQRKQADFELNQTRAELQQLAGYLIQNQEDERHRLSRELHDDIGQRLALLAIEFDRLSQSLIKTEGVDLTDQLEQITSLRTQANEITSDIHQLSHQLHSSKLQHLGLRSALAELARQLGNKNQMAITLKADKNDSLLLPEVALCLFRVSQEALSNIVRHSGAASAQIELTITEGVATLKIRDDGVGFDVNSLAAGIGLVSMRERLRMIGGDFTVESHPSKGTVITAAVSLTVDRRQEIA
jgi:PAS domain S-box-containing protein